MQIDSKIATDLIFALLTETFEKVDGIYLDGGTSLLETLAGISAEEASTPIVAGGTTIAGHVDHARFYMSVIRDYMEGKWHDKVDWPGSWKTKTVTEAEWDALRKSLDDDYRALRGHLEGIADWNDEERFGGAFGIIVHTAFHLGAIRQMVKVVKK